MTYTLAQQYEDDERDYDFLITYVEALRAELAALEAENAVEEGTKRAALEVKLEALKVAGQELHDAYLEAGAFGMWGGNADNPVRSRCRAALKAWEAQP